MVHVVHAMLALSSRLSRGRAVATAVLSMEPMRSPRDVAPKTIHRDALGVGSGPWSVPPSGVTSTDASSLAKLAVSFLRQKRFPSVPGLVHQKTRSCHPMPPAVTGRRVRHLRSLTSAAAAAKDIALTIAMAT